MKLKLMGTTKEQKAFRRGLYIGLVLIIIVFIGVVFAPRIVFPGTFDMTYRVAFDGQKTSGTLGLVGVHRVTVTEDRSGWGVAKHFTLTVYYYDQDVLQSFNGIGWINEKTPMISMSLDHLSDDYSWYLESSVAVPKPNTGAAVYIELIGYDREPGALANIVFEYEVMCYMY